MISMIVWSPLLTNLTINNKILIILINRLLCTTFFLSYDLLEFRNIRKKYLGAYTFDHFIFNVSEIFNKVFTTLFLGFLFYVDFLSRTFTKHRDGISLTPHYHFHQLHRRLDIKPGTFGITLYGSGHYKYKSCKSSSRFVLKKAVT